MEIFRCKFTEIITKNINFAIWIYVFCMKKIAVILTVLLALAATSCKKGVVRSPELAFRAIEVNGEAFTSGTITVEDTLQLYMTLQPYYDHLISLRVTFDHTLLKDSIFSKEGYEKLCNKELSKPAEGYYVFKNMADGTALLLDPAQLIALKSPGTEDKKVVIRFDLESSADVGPEYNPQVTYVSLRIIDKEEKKEE